jgi:hypothetical protein
LKQLEKMRNIARKLWGDKFYSFKKPRRKVGLSEQVDLISISDFEKEKQKDDLQQE